MSPTRLLVLIFVFAIAALLLVNLRRHHRTRHTVGDCPPAPPGAGAGAGASAELLSDLPDRVVAPAARCPNGCSGAHGLCHSDGRCYCASGFSGADCSLPLNVFASRDVDDVSLALVLPMTADDEQRVCKNVATWADDDTRPCTTFNFARRVTLYFYLNEPWSAQPGVKLRLLRELARRDDIVRCFAAVEFITSDSRDEEARLHVPAHRKGVAFDRLWTHTAMRAHDYFFMIEPDALPLRANWAVKAYEEVAFVPAPFWIKGSIARPLADLVNGPFGRLCTQRDDAACWHQCLYYNATEACKRQCTCLEAAHFHINGCAFYNLRSTEFRELRARVRDEHPRDNFDSAWFSYLLVPQRFYQLAAIIHHIRYTQFIQNHHHDEVSRADMRERYPSTYFVHTRQLLP